MRCLTDHIRPPLKKFRTRNFLPGQRPRRLGNGSLLPNSGNVPSPRRPVFTAGLPGAPGKIHRLPALSTLVFPVEFIGKYLHFRSALRTLAEKGREIPEAFESRTMRRSRHRDTSFGQINKGLIHKFSLLYTLYAFCLQNPGGGSGTRHIRRVR